jgi:hypothetical protein
MKHRQTGLRVNQALIFNGHLPRYNLVSNLYCAYSGIKFSNKPHTGGWNNVFQIHSFITNTTSTEV